MKVHPARYSLPGNLSKEGSISHEHLAVAVKAQV